MTAARSHSCTTTGRSWVTKTSVMPFSVGHLVQQVEDLRLHHHVERGRRLVGEQRPAARRRGPSRSRPAGACRRTARAGSAAPPAAGARPARADRAPGPRPPAPGRPRAAGIGSAICQPMVLTGLNAFCAPWKTIAICFQRRRMKPFSPPASRSTPSSRTCPATSALGGSRPISASIVVVLPHPDSPTSPKRSPASRRKSTPRTACTFGDAAGRVEPDVEVVHLEAARAGAHRRRRGAAQPGHGRRLDSRRRATPARPIAARAEVDGRSRQPFEREVRDRQPRVERVLERLPSR